MFYLVPVPLQRVLKSSDMFRNIFINIWYFFFLNTSAITYCRYTLHIPHKEHCWLVWFNLTNVKTAELIEPKHLVEVTWYRILKSPKKMKNSAFCFNLYKKKSWKVKLLQKKHSGNHWVCNYYQILSAKKHNFELVWEFWGKSIKRGLTVDKL